MNTRVLLDKKGNNVSPNPGITGNLLGKSVLSEIFILVS